MVTVTAKLYIGTSGWSYPRGEGTWNGYFYPPGTRNELSYYSEFFNTVEINSSFYSPINPVFAQSWVRKTPLDFKFTAKLWQKFTHPKMFESATGEVAAISQDDVGLFLRGIEPIARAGKLGAIMAQFPPSFGNSDFNRQVISAVSHTFGDYPLAVELRHKSWSDDPKTASLLTDLNIAWVHIDEPKFRFSINEKLPLTSNMAYFRFHGRNARDWWTGNSETRYRYLYSEPELIELRGRVWSASQKSETVYVFFNNHWQGYAPKNAKDLKQALSLQSEE